MLKTLIRPTVAGAIALAAGFAVTPAMAQTWDMPTPYPDATFHTVNIAQFATDVEAATNGALKITVHSAGSLFKHPEIKNAVRSGQVPVGEFLLSLIANENPVFGIDGQPFFASDYAAAEKLWAAQKPVVVKVLAEQGLMPLFSVPWPPQGLYTKNEITSIEDLKGLKFRSYNAALERFGQLAGAAPTQVEVPDIPQAFATGRIEAMITSPSTGVGSKAWDYTNHYYDIQAWLPKNMVVVNKRAFDRLDETVRTAVLNAAAAAEARGWEMSKAETAAKTAELAANGITVHQPTPALMDGLKAIGATMIEEWKATAGEDGAAILAAFAS